jgi:hypothetical protein
MSHIFVSYKSADKDTCLKELIEHLSEIGYTVENGKLWYDQQGLDIGDEWYTEIKSALDDSLAIIVIITENSVESAWVNFEFGYAASQDIPILGIRFDSVARTGLPISYSQTKDWQEVRNNLAEILQVYREKFSLSKLTALAIWRLFEPFMLYTRFFLWMYYQLDHLETKPDCYFDSAFLVSNEADSIEKKIEVFWLNHSPALTRRQKKYFNYFRTVCDEVRKQVFNTIAYPKPEEETQSIQKLNSLLEEFNVIDFNALELENYCRIVYYFRLPNDVFFQKYLKIEWPIRFYSFEMQGIFDDRDFDATIVGKTLRTMIPVDHFERINASIEWVQGLYNAE